MPTPIESAAEVVAAGLDVWDAWGASVDQLNAWMAGSVTGGPNGDGAYPLTNRSGGVTLLACPAKLLSLALRHRIKVIPATPYTVLLDDVGATLRWDGTANCSVRYPSFYEGWTGGLLQMESGKIVPVAVSGATMIHDQSYTRTRGPGSIAGMTVGRQRGAISDWVLGGAVMA